MRTGSPAGSTTTGCCGDGLPPAPEGGASVALAALLERDGDPEQHDQHEDQHEHRLGDLLVAEVGRLGRAGHGRYDEREGGGEAEGAEHPLHDADDSAAARTPGCAPGRYPVTAGSF